MTEGDRRVSDGRARAPGEVAGCGQDCLEADRLAAILLRLRLGGLISLVSVAEAEQMETSTVTSILADAAGQELAVERTGDRSGWLLTAEGRRVGEKLLQHQLDCASTPSSRPRERRRSAVLTTYELFLPLNAAVLDLCTRWQVIQQDPLVLNDHSDPDYDRVIINELAAIHERVGPVCRMLTEAHPRFARYERRLSTALENVVGGQIDWLTKPTVDSYHTIWFELHDDFLATLGLDRASEHARLQTGDTSSDVNRK